MAIAAYPQERTPDRLRIVNEMMRESLGRIDPHERIGFFCECDREGCYQPVWLTRREYDLRRSRPGEALVSDVHAGERPARGTLAPPGRRR